ncbi:MAG: anaerobic ribonucleoside-triphosphate reductase activating protein [Clostridium sp.]|uniref:anaerobic ribonucleoside-triphosphate reductase activating protein n=1 Tax=Clostridium sp. TaxID=1506 RepID=UPI002A8F6D12|nr:anaerobic ribonucleoside-triphosphate reductase activating protein [Clostridium sp.]MDY5097276.1 anaerobic ribonucleoside-triphosphate reductase activating protein [Clostridium sp.]
MKKDKTVRLSGMLQESLVNGPGIRRVFFAQGCIHNCTGCFNAETHDFNGGEEFDMDKLIAEVKVNPMLKGVTFSGGDPWEQADKFAYMAKHFKEQGLNVWCYTGYTYEYILDNVDKRAGWKDLLNNIDVLVDGKFDETKKKEGLKFKGSSNQRIIDINNSDENHIVLKYK